MEYKDFSFEIFGTTWEVKFVEEIKEVGEDKYELGESNSVNNVITISTKDKEGNPLSYQTVQLTLLHEIVHSIFTTGAYINSTEDEPLVEWTARCLKSLLTQNVFKYAE